MLAAAAQAPGASFLQDKNSACIPLSISFTNTSSNATSYYWDFGNGNTSTLETPTNVYLNAGIYDIILIATNSGGVSDTIMMVGAAIAFDQPVAGYYAQNTSSCLDGNFIHFINTTSQSTYWLWDFGDGNTSTDQHPIHSYTNAGTYSVTLIVGNADSCENMITRPGYIAIYADWDAVVTVNDTSVCDINHNFLFSSPTPGVASWLWDFGDGSTSTLQNPSHIYTNPGIDTITLSTTNTNGCSDIQVLGDLITIDLGTPLQITAIANSGCTPFTTTFQDTSQAALSYLWNFGDGTSDTTQFPTHTYSDSGLFDVSLTIISATGCSINDTAINFINVQNPPTASFDPLITTGCSPFQAKLKNTSSSTSCLWYFGNGDYSTQYNASPVYNAPGTYTVTFIAYSNSFCADTIIATDLIHVVDPIVKFAVNQQEGCPPLQVAFSDSTLDATEWLWTFDDGATSTVQNPNHLYESSGSFNVSLVVKNSFGCTGTMVIEDPIETISLTPPYTVPPPFHGCAPFGIGFEDNTFGATSWTWDFGDSSALDTNRVVSHIYTTPGTYDVSLEITSAVGCDQLIPVHSTFIIDQGSADFSFELNICDPTQVMFSDSSENAVSWFWEFGDSAISSLEHPFHVYSSYGRYIVKLSITTAAGCEYKIAKMITVKPPVPIGDPYFIASDSLYPMTADFYANSSTAVSWLWYFGDTSASSTLENPTHFYSASPFLDIVLIMSDGICTDTFTLQLPGIPVPGFEINGDDDSTEVVMVNPPVYGCAPFHIQFQNDFPNSGWFLWDFGDGDTSTLANPTHTYTQAGVYDVLEVGLNDSGEVDTMFLPQFITIGGAEADFTTTRIPTCDSIKIAFTDNSINAYAWNWSFGDGNVSSNQNDSNIYAPVNTTHSVSLSVMDTLGCGNIRLKSIYAGYDEPQFTYSASACAGDTVHFESTLQGVATWIWDFGNGVFSTDSMPSHYYSNDGTYGIVLNTINQNGCARQFEMQDSIEVANPIANFTTSSNLVGCDTLTIALNNISTGATSYLWYFGDGYASTAISPVKHYTTPGVHTVTLTATKAGCQSQMISYSMVNVNHAIADFEYVQSNFCLPISIDLYDSSIAAASWYWDFGDSTTSASQNLQSPSHSFTDAPSGDISLTIVDSNGCTASITKPNIGVLQADFSLTEANGCLPFNSLFAEQSINAIAWNWDFGDGTTSTATAPSHTYTDTGVFTVELVVESVDGCTDTLSLIDAVSVHKPMAAFTSSMSSECAPAVLSFQDSSLNAAYYNWEFGDGTGSINMNPGHIYVAPGNYDISLVVTDSFGCADTIVKSSYVQVLGPTADAFESITGGCEGVEVSFTDQSTNAIIWNWSFGDGYSSTAPNPDHTFQESGSYAISLIVEDSIGCTSLFVISDSITVYPPPVANFLTSDSTICSPYLSEFENHSTGAESYAWSFDDGFASTLEVPEHEFEAGTFSISLVATSIYGCTDTAVGELIVNQSPSIGFSTSATEGCYPLFVGFTSSVQDTIDPRFIWTIGNSVASNEINPTLILSEIGWIDVTLTVINSSGCKMDVTMPELINIADTTAPLGPDVKLVTVLSNTSIKVIWDEVEAEDFAGYIVLRKEYDGSSYQAVVQLSGRGMTEYIDNDVNTLATSYCYKIQTVDNCGLVSREEDLVSHCTIEVSSITHGDKIELNWNPYRGCMLTAYEIRRTDLSGATPVLIGIVTSDQLTYIDSSIICPDLYSYRIKATSICGEEVGSWSDTTVAGPIANQFDGQTVDIVRSTVIDNTFVLTEWAHPVMASEHVSQYKIFRSTGNGTFKYQVSVGPYSTSYIDEDVDVDEESYEYKIEVENTCEVPNTLGGAGTSILLQGDTIADLPVLYWSPYSGWDAGVDHYELERMNENGEWQVIKKMSADERKVIIKK
ncbi:MAG: PKD domain-containing protein [Flavobacteriales bacterium]|nr:PKD domain-containing protein [Flavobacteriales bacterium]